ncbi:MAG: alpha/beta fold hydrolase [Candidatus Levybacteria bacterium]|nr:alpha/beta fold hydrolase [Candidatus Levybacteria bacterium]
MEQPEIPKDLEKPQIIQNPQRRKNWIIKSAFLVVVLFLGVFIYVKQNSAVRYEEITQNLPQNSGILPTPTPFLFEEMTVPFLRRKTYESNLSALEKVSENSSYTSYLTSYKSDGLNINGLITIPKGNTPIGGFPAIVFVHGYIPPKSYQTLVNYSSYVDYLAKNGFVVFKIDLRGHAKSEGDPGGSYYSSDYIVDVLSAYSALQASDFVDPKAIGLWGHSMAGNVVARSLAAKPDIPAVVIWAGAVYTYKDFQDYGISDNSYQSPPQDTQRQRRRKLLFDTYGQFSQDSEFWKQIPMTNYLTDIKGAISLNHAVNDNVVDIRYSRGLSEILDKTNIVHELNEYPSGGHNLLGNTFVLAMDNTVEFFRENLK